MKKIFAVGIIIVLTGAGLNWHLIKDKAKSIFEDIKAYCFFG